jgi:uncharacterized protein
MLGRLARYLRFVGLDTEYIRGLADDEIVARCRVDGRFLLTRDRALSARVDPSLYLASPYVEEQWRQLKSQFPELPTEVRFVRCTLCNGPLAVFVPPPGAVLPPGTPLDRVAAGMVLYRCASCGHLYWAGSHTADLRERLRRWDRRAEP